MADDLDSYWAALDRELELYAALPDLEPLEVRSTDFARVYGVRLTSLGAYRIFGYYSVPLGDGPFAAVLQTPHYGSVNHVPAYQLRQRYAVLTLMHRGQRLADQPFAAAYPGLLTLGIDDPAHYIYRGIVADCLRGAEFLLSRPEVDPCRAAIVGDDLALLTAARRQGFAAVQTSGLLFYRLLEASERSQAYPIEEIQDELRAHPEMGPAVARTLALFDPLLHAPRVSARTLLSVGDADALGGPEWLQPLVDALGGPVEQYFLTHEGRTDYLALDGWLAQQLRAGRGNIVVRGVSSE